MSATATTDDAATAEAGASERHSPEGETAKTGETEIPRMPLSVKSFATAIQNRKASQSVAAAPRTPAMPPVTDGAPNASEPATSFRDTVGTAPARPISVETERAGTSAGSRFASWRSSGGSTAATAAAAGSSAGSPASEIDEARHGTKTASASGPEATPEAAPEAGDDGDLEDFLSAELGSGFDDPLETELSSVSSSPAQGGLPGSAKGSRPAALATNASWLADDRASAAGESRPDGSGRTDTPTQSAPTQSNWSAELSSLDVEPLGDRATAPAVSIPTVSLDEPDAGRAAPRVELDRPSRGDGTWMPSRERSSQERPDATTAAKPANHALELDETRKPAGENQVPRKLSLEEEMERLLGDFSFDDPERREV